LANVNGPTVALIEPGQAKVSFVNACAAEGDGAAASTASSREKIPNREANFILDDSSHAAPTQGQCAEPSPA
jgi:hypothetical protein